MTLPTGHSPQVSDRAWRPLLMGEYPPPGPTKLGPAVDGKRPILVYAKPLPEREAKP